MPTFGIIASGYNVPAGGSPTVRIHDSFTDSAGGINGNAPDTVGSATWNANSAFEYNGSGTCQEKSTSSHVTAVIDCTSSDFKVESDMVLSRGSANGRWNGIVLKSPSGGSANDTLSVRADGTGGAPDLVLFDATATKLKTWDISSINIDSTGSRLTSGDQATLRVEYDDTLGANGRVTVYLDDQSVGTYDLTSLEQTEFAAYTYAGLYGNERVNPGSGVWYDFKVTDLA